MTTEYAAPAADPIYRLPPGELWPERVLTAAQLAESRDWGHGPLGLEALHARGITGAGVTVAVLDTGVDAAHPDLRARTLPGRDFTGGTSPADRQGHGTHCAGIVAASSNGDGLIGAAPDAKVLPVKVLDDGGSGASTWIAAGIRWAADQGADVLSLSLGGPAADAGTRAAIQYATGKGCWVVCAAGNDGRPATSYPGHYPESVAVAAVDKDLRRATFSTINPQNDVGAPGVSILSTLPNGRYGNMSGTSMATPYVAGCLALVRGELKRLGRPVPDQAALLAAIGRTSRDIAPAGPDADTGAGLVQPAALLADLAGGPTPPPDPTVPPPTPEQQLVWITLPNLPVVRGVIPVGRYAARIEPRAAKELVPDLPQPEPLMSTVTIPVGKQPVEIFGLKVGSVPAHTLTGTIKADAGPAAPADWLAGLLRQLCQLGPQLPPPLNHGLALVCYFLSEVPGAGAQLKPADVLRLLCQYAHLLPAPYGTLVSLACRFLVRAEAAPCGCN